MGRLTNWAVSTARANWYRVTEPAKLALLRDVFECDYQVGDAPLVTCYVPTHNRVDLLIERSLKSIMAQSYDYLEIIVAAHGCTDDTVKRVRALGDRRIKVIDVPRKRTYPPSLENHWFAGPVVPANAALSASLGDWVARNDDDDTWTPDHIESLLRFAQRGNHEFVSSYHATPTGFVQPYEIDGKKIGGTQTWLYRSYLKAYRYNPDCWRKSWNRVNDTDLQDRFVKAGVRIGFHSASTAYVFPRPGESDVGLKAYQADADNKSKQLAF